MPTMQQSKKQSQVLISSLVIPFMPIRLAPSVVKRIVSRWLYRHTDAAYDRKFNFGKQTDKYDSFHSLFRSIAHLQLSSVC